MAPWPRPPHGLRLRHGVVQAWRWNFRWRRLILGMVERLHRSQAILAAWEDAEEARGEAAGAEEEEEEAP